MNKFIDIKYEKESYKKIARKSETNKWMTKLFKELNIDNSSCSIYFASSESIQQINKEYRNKDYPTDVLSFSQIEGEKIDFINSNFLGDIAICISIAEKQAEEMGHSTQKEIYMLLLHGLLHLIGYDHEKDDDDKMLNLQKKIFYNLTGDKIE